VNQVVYEVMSPMHRTPLQKDLRADTRKNQSPRFTPFPTRHMPFPFGIEIPLENAKTTVLSPF